MRLKEKQELEEAVEYITKLIQGDGMISTNKNKQSTNSVALSPRANSTD
jgi:glycerol-3-phosphate responsive antiterminator